MTNENAIRILHWLKPSYIDKENFNFTQAIEMAVEALEKQIPMKLLPQKWVLMGE